MERAPAGAPGALTPYFPFFSGPLGPQILIAVLLPKESLGSLGPSAPLGPRAPPGALRAPGALTPLWIPYKKK